MTNSATRCRPTCGPWTPTWIATATPGTSSRLRRTGSVAGSRCLRRTSTWSSTGNLSASRQGPTPCSTPSSPASRRTGASSARSGAGASTRSSYAPPGGPSSAGRLPGTGRTRRRSGYVLGSARWGVRGRGRACQMVQITPLLRGRHFFNLLKRGSPLPWSTGQELYT